MDLQEALDAPTVHSIHFPSSFYPRAMYPGQMVAEGRIPKDVIAELERRGHEVRVADDYPTHEYMTTHMTTHKDTLPTILTTPIVSHFLEKLEHREHREHREH